MDGWFLTDGGRTTKSVAFLTPQQAELYGGYVDAAKVLHVDYIQPPCMVGTFWSDMPETIQHVGHA